jgi:polyisoprenoid-binding protein YceI
MSRLKIVLLASTTAVALVAIGLFAFLALRDDGPAELVIGERATTTASGSSEASSTTAAPPSEIEGVEGTWSTTDDSLAGYRVVEDFVGGLSDFEAVGRTSVLDGTLTIEGTTVTDARFSVDVASITSDDGRRDGQFRGRIMDAAGFPEATFVLTSPIELGSIPAAGQQITASAAGELTLRGATVPVEFPLTARIVGEEIETLGSIPVLFSDYGIDNPSNAIVSVRDDGVVEFSLIFARG